MINSLFKKQSGYALILVLLAITLIGVLSIPIVNSVLNSSQQYQKTEQNIQKEKLREMGIVYMESVVNNAINNLTTLLNDGNFSLTTSEQYKNQLQSELLKIVPELNSGAVKVIEEDRFMFSIKINSMELTADKNIIISYTVIPSINRNIEAKNASDEEVIINVKKE